MPAIINASNNTRSQQLCAVPIHDRGKNAQCHQQRAMPSTTHDRSNTTIDASDNEQCQQLADDATDNKRRWHNGPSQQQRTMPAITNDRSNNTPCQQQRTTPATTGPHSNDTACDYARCWQQRAMQQQCAIPPLEQTMVA